MLLVYVNGVEKNSAIYYPKSFLHQSQPNEVAVDDMLIGMEAIAPNLATPANAHEYGSTDRVV
ncbi:hypothetical protein [Nostoc sp. TCL240-02]|uniref:hypothetical protein n=1 Tax=Nostoc sp. TCL240-02 TaxID=2572090 RepID=UPI00157FBBBD|nr:hypothetical protein [Nostoc sp. TCL240-02]QKQ76196.1 hypothetical protein FBB35_25515 [Nostoc sp. TCL240-02]